MTKRPLCASYHHRAEKGDEAEKERCALRSSLTKELPDSFQLLVPSAASASQNPSKKKHMGLLHWVMFVLEIPNGLAETSPLTSFLRLASSPFPVQLMLPINTFILSTLSLSICFLIKQTVGQGECTLSPERH